MKAKIRIVVNDGFSFKSKDWPIRAVTKGIGFATRAMRTSVRSKCNVDRRMYLIDSSDHYFLFCG